MLTLALKTLLESFIDKILVASANLSCVYCVYEKISRSWIERLKF